MNGETGNLLCSYSGRRAEGRLWVVLAILFLFLPVLLLSGTVDHAGATSRLPHLWVVQAVLQGMACILAYILVQRARRVGSTLELFDDSVAYQMWLGRRIVCPLGQRIQIEGSRMILNAPCAQDGRPGREYTIPLDMLTRSQLVELRHLVEDLNRQRAVS